MKSKIRHDLRHPLATISMIASTIAAFGDEVDAASIEGFKKQVLIELHELTTLIEEHSLELPIEELRERVGRFSADPTVQSAEALGESCHGLISELSSGGSGGS